MSKWYVSVVLEDVDDICPGQEHEMFLGSSIEMCDGDTDDIPFMNLLDSGFVHSNPATDPHVWKFSLEKISQVLEGSDILHTPGYKTIRIALHPV